jgi:hypothetical protein
MTTFTGPGRTTATVPRRDTVTSSAGSPTTAAVLRPPRLVWDSVDTPQGGL